MTIKKIFNELNLLCHTSFKSDSEINDLTEQLDSLMTELRNFGDTAWLDASLKQSFFLNYMQRNKEHASQKLKDATSIVYLLKGCVTGYYKIGVTTNLNKRIKQVRNNSSEEITLEFLSRGGRELEKVLHQKYESQKVKGEWFKLTENETNEVKFIMRGQE